jgi:hypothetical protein
MRLPPGLAMQAPAGAVPSGAVPAAPNAGEASLMRAQAPLVPAASARPGAAPAGGGTTVVLGTVGSTGEARATLALARTALPSGETGVQLVAEPTGSGFRIVARGFSSVQAAQGFCAQAARQGLVCGGN